MMNSFYYSPATGGFYLTEFHGDDMPADKVEITEDLYSALLQGEQDGKVIAPPDDAHPLPYLADPPPPSEAELAILRIAVISAQLSAIQADIVTYSAEIADIVSFAVAEGRACTDQERYTLDEQGTFLADCRAEALTLEQERETLQTVLDAANEDNHGE